MAETIPKLITDVEKYFQYEGSANPTTQDELQAFMKNEHSVVACLAKKLWQPETNYTQGQIVESPNMPVGFYAVALVNGTSYSNEPDWGNGSVDISDGSMKWNLTQGNITVNGEAPDENGNIVVKNLYASKWELSSVLWKWFHRFGNNYIPETLDNAGWSSLGICIISYDTPNKINNQPTTNGQLINIPYSGSIPRQIWIDQPSGNIWHRGGDSSKNINNESFIKLVNYNDVFNASGHLVFPSGNQMWIE